jgi:hypothetical protein
MLCEQAMQAYTGHARMQELAAQQELRSACKRVLRAATLSLTSLYAQAPRPSLRSAAAHVHLCGATLRAGLSQATHRLALIFRTLSPRVKPSNLKPAQALLLTLPAPHPPPYGT